MRYDRMTTDTERFSVRFSEEDYQWLNEKAELTGNSRAAVLRQIVRGLRLERPGLLTFGNRRLVFADEANYSVEDNPTQEQDDQVDDAQESGIEAFRTDR